MEPFFFRGVQKAMGSSSTGFRSQIEFCPERKGDFLMNSIIYLVGLVVIVMFVLSYFGLR